MHLSVLLQTVVKAEKGYCTCKQQAHQEMEKNWNAKGQAFFKLVEQLKWLNIGNVVNLFMGDTGVKLDDDAKMEDTPKSDQGDQCPRAQFGWHCTHNKQLVVCCCGVIAAHSTMFGAEAISGVKVCTFSSSKG